MEVGEILFVGKLEMDFDFNFWEYKVVELIFLGEI